MPLDYAVTVCPNCDPVKPGGIGDVVDERCPECGAQMHGLIGTDDELKPRWIDHNWLLISLAAAGQHEAIEAIQDCWDEIDRLRMLVYGAKIETYKSLQIPECLQKLPPNQGLKE